MIYFGYFFLNLFKWFPSAEKGASRAPESLGLPGMEEQIGILERKCIDMRGISG